MSIGSDRRGSGTATFPGLPGAVMAVRLYGLGGEGRFPVLTDGGRETLTVSLCDRGECPRPGALLLTWNAQCTHSACAQVSPQLLRMEEMNRLATTPQASTPQWSTVRRSGMGHADSGQAAL